MGLTGYLLQDTGGFPGGVLGWIIGFLNGLLVVLFGATHPYFVAGMTIICMVMAPIAGQAFALFVRKYERLFKSVDAREDIPDRDIRLRAKELTWCNLAPCVLAVAVAAGDTWTGYIDAVPGHNYDTEAPDVVLHGSKLTRELASSIWPQFATLHRYEW